MLIIRKFKSSDTYSAAKLVSETFKKYNCLEGTKEAVAQYVNFYNPDKNNLDKIKVTFSKTEIFFVAIENNKIIGIIRGKKNMVTNLFVNGKYHKNGIATNLLKRFEKECIKKGSKEIKLKASLYGTPFYQKSGYKKTTGMRTFNGLKIYPMKKNLN